MPKLEKSFPWILLLAHFLFFIFFFNFRAFNARFPMVMGKPLSHGFPSPEQQLEAPRCIGKLKLGRGFGVTEQRDAGQALQELALTLPELPRSCCRRSRGKKPFLPAPVEANPNFFHPGCMEEPSPGCSGSGGAAELWAERGFRSPSAEPGPERKFGEHGGDVEIWEGDDSCRAWGWARMDGGRAEPRGRFSAFFPQKLGGSGRAQGAGRGAAAAQARGTSRTV